MQTWEARHLRDRPRPTTRSLGTRAIRTLTPMAVAATAPTQCLTRTQTRTALSSSTLHSRTIGAIVVLGRRRRRRRRRQRSGVTRHIVGRDIAGRPAKVRQIASLLKTDLLRTRYQTLLACVLLHPQARILPVAIENSIGRDRAPHDPARSWLLSTSRT